MKLMLPLFLALVIPAHAVLAPNYQRLAELKEILNDPAVVATFDVYHPIDRVEYIHKDLYQVSAGTCHVDVTLADKPAKSGMAGPRQFTISVSRKTCR